MVNLLGADKDMDNLLGAEPLPPEPVLLRIPKGPRNTCEYEDRTRTRCNTLISILATTTLHSLEECCSLGLALDRSCSNLLIPNANTVLHI